MFTLGNISRETAADLVVRGIPFKVVQGGAGLPMVRQKWDCAFFKSSKLFRGAEMRQSYGGGNAEMAIAAGWENVLCAADY